ncbi:auxin-responsive protein IAA32-like isoform X4 [Nymphaea colorata]|uniref:auxin-responsive protein IAA32-like isoform X4 n=1 Tax=Nymphaea colorata TaxID=210225 RepID=UPI00214E53F6|nr:auxin-responsive protein IAA32-like isoform X4 [Nymphaea colorata]
MLPSVSGYGGNEATIDLGLSLGSWLQQEANAPQQALQKKASMVNLEVGIEEEAGKQSTRGSGFVKVNMDEIGIGRKICVMDYAGYAGLALELEKMFGTHSPSGLRLLDQDSSFSLVYKDRNTGDWMPISNFSWQCFSFSSVTTATSLPYFQGRSRNWWSDAARHPYLTGQGMVNA